MTSNSDAALQGYVRRIEALEAQKTEIAEDIKEIYLEVKKGGIFDPKILRKLIRERKRSAAELAVEAATLAAYRNALGQLADTPLGKAAMEKVT